MRIRSVQPEILETLASDDPAARRGRQDLLLVNGIMGNHRWISRMMRRYCQPGWQMTELGAGDGALSLKLAQQGLCQTHDLHAFDLAPRPASWPADAAWTQGDLFAQNLPPSQVLIANLFLHHFEAAPLHLLGSRIAPETQLILAAEPARYRIHTFMGRLFCSLAQLNWVTRYDMQVSIRAGFRGQELPDFLGLDSSWEISVRETVFGGYRMMARRK
ncbi:methyltransferase domain-containing protein [Prosthecobacter dejongeii]|uniref:Methyltransferase domain-containing protein n=1 Tax=Prosthecobacter dejongeii TaxID=48465 RepID=A0A7W7YQG4_9BACT|nr:class I SAM-dependent methyltransferase [Prosthecobacter dejongeii]MBB5040230.1 hypothetical protein [Prosthecobacter dejongeii]